MSADYTIDKIINSIKRLNSFEIDVILSRNSIYMNSDKDQFIQLLRQTFQKFQNYGDTELLMLKGRCKFCEDSGGSYTFVGNHSRNFIEIIITELEGGDHVSIQECYCHPADSENPYGGTRLYIDPSQGSPF